MRSFIFTLLLLCSICNSHAQHPKKLNTSQIFEAIQKLNVLASVLYVAAHPDDENTRLIAYMANHLKARTAYLSLTRGDGGQNLIGPELRELLGVIRTQELLAARGVDGGEQWFSRANDFGFSKHPNETFAIWDKDQVLADMVWTIRAFKPDIIINRFDHRTPGTTHGHHTASAMLSHEAFDISNQKTTYPKQLKYTQTWQAKRLFFNTSWWFYGSRENFENADKSNMLHFDVGVYYPHKGLSNNELASLASSQHLCQGFGRLSRRGSQDEYIELLKGDALQGDNPFEGINTSWGRIKGGKAIGNILEQVEENFNFNNPSEHIADLVKAYQLLQRLNDPHWKHIKSEELKAIIEACVGLYLEASSDTPTATNNENITINIEALNRSNTTIILESYKLSTLDEVISKDITLPKNKTIALKEDLIIPDSLTNTSAYWLNTKGSLGMYKVNNQKLIGKPETPRAINITFNLLINNVRIPFSKPIVYRYSKPDKGELYRPFEIVPPVSSYLKDKVLIFDSDREKEVEVIVKAGKDAVDGFVQLAHPNDWQVYPKQQKFIISKKGDIKTLVFTIFPPKQQSEGLVSPMVNLDGKFYTRQHIEINYPHIPFQTVYLPSESKIVRLKIKKQGNNIGYIEGAGDVVPESLRQIGYKVSLIKPEEISIETLSKFDAVVMGIRAYNVLDALAFKQKYLLDYVKQGGNLVVQYNTNRRLKVEDKDIAPFRLKLSRDRVTDENAPITILNPEHPILNFPNKITSKDFEGWVQERGLYFPDEWDTAFTPLLSAHDKGESPKKGSLLVAKYGNGHYIYTGLSFFREFPAGVPGAYRLFANLLSAGK